ncbi:MAG: GntP family permease [Gemmataceae bacterium]
MLTAEKTILEPSLWAALCTAAALVALLVLIIRFKFQAFVALIVVSLVMGLVAGMPPVQVVKAIGSGVGGILGSVAIILALGAILGRMLEASGSAEAIARPLIDIFGIQRASWAILIAAYLLGIPVLFNVGFLLLIPIMWRLQRDTGQSLLWFALPMSFSLGITHSLIPPHPGIIGAVGNMKGNMVETMIFGSMLGIPLVIVGWAIPARFWASRQMVIVPPMAGAAVEAESDKEEESNEDKPLPSFWLVAAIVTLPLWLSLVGFSVDLLQRSESLPVWMTAPLLFEPGTVPAWLRIGTAPLAEWLLFLGQPMMALLIPTGAAFLFLGWRRGMVAGRLTQIANTGLRDIGDLALLFGAAGGFKEVIEQSGAGAYIAEQMIQLPLSPVLVAYLTAVLVRIALGSATAAILTASALLADMTTQMPGHTTVLILAVAVGVTFMTQPADSGFWMVKEYINLNVKEVMLYFNGCRIFMSLTGVVILLIVEALLL